MDNNENIFITIDETGVDFMQATDYLSTGMKTFYDWEYIIEDGEIVHGMMWETLSEIGDFSSFGEFGFD